MKSWKPGSESDAAAEVQIPGDFGVPEGTAPTRDRAYVSANTKRSDRGVTQPMAHEHEGVRTSGAGSSVSGTGSGSGGDIDPDFIGVGAGGSGIAQSAPGRPPGPDDNDGTSNEFASPLPSASSSDAEVTPAHRRNQSGIGRVGGDKRVRGSVMQRDAGADATLGQGADAATNPLVPADDSFASEVSSGEAAGEDLPMGPSSDTQGIAEEDNT